MVEKRDNARYSVWGEDEEAIKFLLDKINWNEQKKLSNAVIGPVNKHVRKVLLEKFGKISVLDTERVFLLNLNEKTLESMREKVHTPEGIVAGKLEKKDLKQVYSIWPGREDHSERYMEETIEHTHTSCLREGEKIVAFVNLHDDEALGMLFVREEYRKKGLARAVVFNLLQNVFNGKERVIHSEVNVENENSLKLHAFLDFEPLEETIYWIYKL